MAAPTNTPLTEEIWHLSIDDLLAPLPEAARLGGPGPFVINLSASTAPIALPAKSIAGCEQAHMYQLQRTEDRRPRYRLRLGPFGSEDEADAILKIVRDIYPGALTATADADDLRAIATLRAKTGALPSPTETPPASIEKPTEKPAVAPVSLPPAPQAVSSRPVAKPAVSAVPPAVPTLSAAPAAPAKPMAPAAPTLSAAPAAIPTLTAPVPRQEEQLSKRVPNLDATQTVRALTQLELEDDGASRWFVIQLSLAEDPFDPDTLPNL